MRLETVGLIAATAGLFVAACGDNGHSSQEPRVVAKLYSGEKLPLGIGPTDLGIGDLNGDGIPDLVAANAASNDVSVLLGAGGGAFEPAMQFPVGIRPVSLAIADINDDGHSDVISANGDSDTVTVLLGRGDGRFDAAASFPCGMSPGSVAVADLTGDGYADIVTANGGSGDVTVLNGTGDGAFREPRSFSAGPAPYGIAVTDFNGDGLPDVVTTTSGGIAVLLGTADGGLGAVRHFSAAHWGALAIADLNGDGNVDVAMAEEEGRAIHVLMGTGTGDFAASRLYDTVGLYPNSISIGDLNGDGHLDLITANYDNGYNSAMSVFLGRGGGELGSPRTFPVGGVAWRSVRVWDVDNDGHDDLLSVDSVRNEVTVLFGAGDGDLHLVREVTAGSATSDFGNVLTTGDFNGDGVPDVVTTSSWNGGSHGDLRVLLGLGDGELALSNRFEVTAPPFSVDAADFNNDGRLDLVASVVRLDEMDNCEQVAIDVLLGTGDGGFASALSFPIAAGCPGAIAVADLNEDGRPDVVVANGEARTVTVLFGTADRALEAPQAVGVPAPPHAVAIADVNRDGHLDLVTANGKAASVSVLLGSGNGSFHSARVLPVVGGPVAIVVADVDGDENVDIVTGNGESHTISVLRGVAGGDFEAARTFTVPGNPISLAVGDVDGDGTTDVVSANQRSGGKVSVLLGAPMSLLGPLRHFMVSTNGPAIGPSNPDSVALVDLNRDGMLDVVTANRDPGEEIGTVSVLLHQ